MTTEQSSSPKSRTRKIFYGWWVSLAGAANMFVSSGPTYVGASTLFRAIEDEFGWSRTIVTGVASFGRFGGALLGPVEGWMTDKFGTGKMVLLGFTLGGLGLIFYSQLQGPIQYYLAYFVISLGFSVGGFVPSMAAVNAWMPHRRATAMSIVIGGSSLSALLLPAIVWGITTHGWRDTTLVMGIISLACGPPLAYISGKRVPAYEELDAQISDSDTGSDQEKTNSIAQHDFTAKEALRTRGFWALSITHMLTNLSVGTITAHLYFQLTDKSSVNLSDAAAATVIPIMGITQFTFQMIGGYTGDRINKRILLPPLLITQAASLVVLAHATNYFGALIFAVLWGLGFGARTPMLHALRGEFFGRKHFGVILGMSGFPMLVGMMVTPVIVGWVFDRTGTYETSLYTLALACLIGTITILLATKPVSPKHR